MHMHLNSQSFKPHQGTPLTAAPAAQGETSPNVVRACAREPTPSPSQEGSNTGWPVPLLGGVRGGLVGSRFMGKGIQVSSSPRPSPPSDGGEEVSSFPAAPGCGGGGPNSSGNSQLRTPNSELRNFPSRPGPFH